MSDLVQQLEWAFSLHIRGRSEEALEAGSRLLPQARGTPHGARVYRVLAEFRHALGDYEGARQAAEESAVLARAVRNPDEILASNLVELDCDLYEGRITTAYEQLLQLIKLTGDQPRAMIFMARLLLLAGDFDAAVELAERCEGPTKSAYADLARAHVMLLAGKAHLLACRPAEALAVLERAATLEVPTLVPGILAEALIGLALAQSKTMDAAMEHVDRSAELARKISRDIHGQALAVSGLARQRVGETGVATEQLASAVGLMSHPIERQESFCSLGDMSIQAGDREEAEFAYRRALEPTTESHFGRLAVRALRDLVGLRAV